MLQRMCTMRSLLYPFTISQPQTPPCQRASILYAIQYVKFYSSSLS